MFGFLWLSFWYQSNIGPRAKMSFTLIYYPQDFVKRWYSFFFIYLVRFISEGTWSWTFFFFFFFFLFVGGMKIMNSVCLFVFFVFRLSLSSWDCFGNFVSLAICPFYLSCLIVGIQLFILLPYNYFNFYSVMISLQHGLQCVIFHSWFWQFLKILGVTWYNKTIFFSCKGPGPN